MKKHRLFAAVLVLSVFFPFHAAAQSPLAAHFFIPKYYPTVEETMGRLKNIQPMILSPEDGTLRSVEADRFGIRFSGPPARQRLFPSTNCHECGFSITLPSRGHAPGL